VSQRLKVKEIVFEMHEKNVVLRNILRDIVENETEYNLEPSHEDFQRVYLDKIVRRNELIAEIQHFLSQEDKIERFRI
jgi:hypothetical protein